MLEEGEISILFHICVPPMFLVTHKNAWDDPVSWLFLGSLNQWLNAADAMLYES